MIKESIKRHFTNQIQVIEFDADFVIISSDDAVFTAVKDNQLTEVHPFFTILETFDFSKTYEELFKTITLDIDDSVFVVDVLINTGDSAHNAFVVVYNNTPIYKELQQVTQRKNELFLTNFYETEKNIQLNKEKYFKNHFLANISHELKTPISGIIGLIDLFKKEDLTFEQKEFVNTILHSMYHLNRLVADLLDLSKIESGEFKIIKSAFDLNDIFKNIEKVFLQKFFLKNIEFKIIKNPKSENLLLGDSSRIIQIITNLLENAYKFTETGSVELEISSEKVSPHLAHLNIRVTDTGMGFDTKNNKLLFKSYAKLHDKNIEGSGLGLSIISQIIELLQGDFTYDSKLGVGSTFQVSLPLEVQSGVVFDNTSSARVFAKEDFKEEKYHILIVEDNEINQIVLMKMLLNHGGFYIDMANDGLQALEKIALNSYDLVFMDIQMPKMNGVEAIENIRNKNKDNTPIIAISAFDAGDLEEKSKTMGVNGYVVKPYNKEQLFSEIYKVLEI